MRARLLLFVAVWGVGCGDSSNLDNKKVGEDDERQNVGTPEINYCVASGNKNVNEGCMFPDGSVCSIWLFFYGQCGKQYSYCEQHGGSLSTEVRSMGSWTATVAVCTLNGVQCDEATFARSGQCVP